MVGDFKTEEYGGRKIYFFKGKGGIVFAQTPSISKQYIGYGKTKQQALDTAKNVIDSVNNVEKMSKGKAVCDPNDLERDNNLVSEYRKDGMIMLIYPDENPESPRSWSNYGIMATAHRRYDLGDEKLPADEYNSWDEIRKYLIKEKDAIPSSIAPLYLYDHSGLRIKIGSFSGLLPQGHAEFDSGQVGFIYTTKAKIKEMNGTTKFTSKIQKYLEGEVETYDQYLSGDVYGRVVFECKNGVWEEVDSVWGFYGYDFENNGIFDDFGKGWKEV